MFELVGVKMFVLVLAKMSEFVVAKMSEFVVVRMSEVAVVRISEVAVVRMSVAEDDIISEFVVVMTGGLVVVSRVGAGRIKEAITSAMVGFSGSLGFWWFACIIFGVCCLGINDNRGS